MKDEEFVKLRHWLDAELTLIRVLLVIVIGYEVHKKWVWAGVIVYAIFSVLYAATRLAYVESKHKGYLRIPNNRDYE